MNRTSKCATQELRGFFNQMEPKVSALLHYNIDPIPPILTMGYRYRFLDQSVHLILFAIITLNHIDVALWLWLQLSTVFDTMPLNWFQYWCNGKTDIFVMLVLEPNTNRWFKIGVCPKSNLLYPMNSSATFLAQVFHIFLFWSEFVDFFSMTLTFTQTLGLRPSWIHASTM